MEEFVKLPIVKRLISESDVKNVKEALIRPFFMGLDGKCEPALTENSVKRRLNDENFCRFCFMYDEHDTYCRDSGWGEFLPKPHPEERGMGFGEKNLITN
jgi:hypothetical protein